MKPYLSIVSPVYKAKLIVPELVRRIVLAVSEITEEFEVILVDDGCPDNSWTAIEEVCSNDLRVKGVKLSRNFGQHYAITAGLSNSSGQWVVVMDCDLQDRPEEIHKLFTKANEGYDIVFARRIIRKDAFLKRMSSKMFHSLYGYLSGFKSDPTIANFGIYSKNVIDEFNKMQEKSRSFPSLVNYLGFRKTSIEVEHAERSEGESSYSLSRLLRLSFDVILANSNKPLKLTIKLGFFISFFSFALAIYNLIAHWFGIIKVPGFTSTIFSIWFVGGLILFVLGIHGLYVGKIFDQVKNRQLYIVSNRLNFDEHENS